MRFSSAPCTPNSRALSPNTHTHTLSERQGWSRRGPFADINCFILIVVCWSGRGQMEGGKKKEKENGRKGHTEKIGSEEGGVKKKKEAEPLFFLFCGCALYFLSLCPNRHITGRRRRKTSSLCDSVGAIRRSSSAFHLPRSLCVLSCCVMFFHSLISITIGAICLFLCCCLTRANKPTNLPIWK